MKNLKFQQDFTHLSTPLITDACMRLKIPHHIAPPAIKPINLGTSASGRVLPVRHSGSVDIFLETMGMAEPGDVMVIDNENRFNEGCIGDLIVLEAQAYGLSAMIVWGANRDTPELRQIAFPVFSCGHYPSGPQRLDPRNTEALVSAQIGDFEVTREDAVFADDDGVIFVPLESVVSILDVAQAIQEKERHQAQAIKNGNTLHKQLQFDSYMEKKKAYPSYTFRQHLRIIGGEIEE